ncbi:hypothetical protein R50345_27510 [Paenibacillus sp. FSL R5-0345]|uniref:hypothetical protein n=1 Tax=Paenibacillus sp. FSL R5-0345 TaxID=1536770 RepID=UPI0004F8599E|nr:hypothetical protein [Paenibacillus sp. FSL R5-0345]AIQ38030.1 hypothetical protein R50345_27510 [Paenibacillus sp. FSL R5-0345]
MQITGNLGLKKPEGTDIVDIADLNGNMDILDNAVNGKVDKVTGKQLSTNDYTTAEKTKLAGIATGANNYSHPNHTGDVTSNGDGVTAIAAGVIVNADVNAAAGIDALKIGTGVVSNTEFGYLDGVTSGIQGQLNGKAPLVTTPQQTTADITYYVRTDGNDTNNGSANTSAGAFKTINRAIGMIPQVVNHTASINVASGTYAEDVRISGKVGGGHVQFMGTSVTIRSFVAERCNRIVIDGFSANTTTSMGFNAYDGGNIDIKNCSCETTANYPGINIAGQNADIRNSSVSGRNFGIIVGSASIVTSLNNTGQANGVGLYASHGGSIYKYGSQPSGITSEGSLNGIITSGVFNPWGDNTTTSRPTAEMGHTGADQFASAGVWNKVLFNLSLYNIKNTANAANSRMVAPETGVYLLNVRVAISNTGVGRGALGIFVNGILNSVITEQTSDAIQVGLSLGGSALLRLDAGQYMEVYLNPIQNVSIPSSDQYTHVSLIRIA